MQEKKTTIVAASYRAVAVASLAPYFLSLTVHAVSDKRLRKGKE